MAFIGSAWVCMQAWCLEPAACLEPCSVVVHMSPVDVPLLLPAHPPQVPRYVFMSDSLVVLADDKEDNKVCSLI